MSYLQDKKSQRRKFSGALFIAVLLLILIYFRAGIFSGLSSLAQYVFHPVLTLGNSIGGGFSNFASSFTSQSSLMIEKENLENRLNEQMAQLSNYNTIEDDNAKMKEILGRKGESTKMILAATLSKPDRSLYDTLLIDAGKNEGVAEGQRVFALGNIPIGRIAEVYRNSSKVILFSNPGESTEVVVSGKDVFLQAIGRGGGNFEMILVKDLVLEKGAEIVLPGIESYLLGTVETVISDARDAFKKAILASPVNVQELKFVQIETQR